MFGFINVNKPTGITSRAAVDQVVEQLREKRIGHAGTLDPLAEGVLVLAVGKASKLISVVQDFPKTYLATFQLGLASDTQDITGECREVPWVPFSKRDLEIVAEEFVGEILQTPPVFSALRVNGKRAYRLGRRGETVELAPRPVVIHSLRIIDVALPHWTMEIECSKGTYVRTLGHDMGIKLGSHAVMTALTRTAIGPFSIADAVNPDEVRKSERSRQLIPLAKAFPNWPQVVLSEPELADLQFGRLPVAIISQLDSLTDHAILLTPNHDLAAVIKREEAKLSFVINLFGK
ncbi:MAG: tRNA pseudouridine(55) synthase TruB [Pirellulaceae bacterium]|jgi:tRNA pseudouridine55 synthase|nr:tRNA pseudouridine(55) synthase TruB [Pirellulaceae bacterium]